MTYQLEVYLRVLNITLDHPVSVYFDDLSPMGLIFHRLVVGIGHICPGIVRKIDVLPGEGGNQASVQCVGEPEKPTGAKRLINRHAIGGCDRHRCR